MSEYERKERSIMQALKCPYCGSTTFDKFIPRKGDKMFIGSADTKTGVIYADDGFICDLYVCKECGNVHLQLGK